MIRIPVIPEYYKDLPNTVNLNSKEVAKMFNYQYIESLGYAYKHGIIPKPNYILQQSLGKRRKMKIWKLGAIRKWGAT